MPQVGYNVIPSGGTIDLASIDQNQQRINLAKQQQGNEQMNQIMNTVMSLMTKAQDRKGETKLAQQKLAADLYTKLIPTTYTYTDPTTGEVKSYSAGGNDPKMLDALSKIMGGALGIKDQGGMPETGTVSPKALSQPTPTDYMNIMRQNRLGPTADYLSTLPQDKPISESTGVGTPQEYAYNLLSKMGIQAPQPNAPVQPQPMQPQPNQPMRTEGIKPPAGFMIEQSGGKTRLVKMPTAPGLGGFSQELYNKLGGEATPEQLQANLKQQRPEVFNYYQQVAKGKIPIMGRFGMAANQVNEDVINFFPDFDPTKYETRQKTRMDFTSGKSGQNVRSLNTAIEHLNELNSLIPTLQTSGWKSGNKIINFITRETGKTGVPRFGMVANALNGELATIFKNSGGTDQEIANIGRALSNSDSPDNIRDVLKGAVSLMAGRMNALDYQWKTSFDQPEDKAFPIMSPQAKGILNKLGLGDYIVDAKNSPESSIGKSKAQRANQIYQQNPSLSKDQIIDMVNKEMGQ